MTRDQLSVRNGFEYDSYFPRAIGQSITKKKGATVADTIRFIPNVVYDTLPHTKRFAFEVIKAPTLYETCKNLWEFVFNHIKYRKDEDGKEQVRSPARSWSDRQQGVDCDCYTVFISSILTNLKIKHVLRITKYGEDHFQHIYPIVPIGNGKYITIDCVVLRFNYEEPYTEKKDTAMDLEYLNGVTDTSNNGNIDSQDLMGMMSEREAMAELGRLFKRKSSGEDSSSEEGGGKKKGRFKKILSKGLHFTNLLNPATVAIRVGVLAAMKLNFMKIGSELKYTYLTDEEAQKRGLNMDRFPKMKRIREKLEKIFYGAGGKPENLKKAILKGKGNRNKDVPLDGLGYFESVDGLHEDMSLSQLLGSDMMASESMHEVQGLGELGEPATAATIAAASTVLTTIVALIKKVGSLIPKKKAGEGGDGASNDGSSGDSGGGDDNQSSSSADGGSTNNSTNSSTENKQDASTNNQSTAPTTTNTSSENTPAVNKEEGDTEGDASSNQRKSSSSKETNSNSTNTKPPSFWEKNKKWITPTGIAVGTIGLIALIHHLLKSNTATAQTPKPSLSGVPKHKTNSTNKKQVAKKGGHKPHHKTKQVHKKHKTESIALM